MESRRELIKKLTVGAAAVSAGALVSHKQFFPFFNKTSSKESPWWLLEPMQKGVHVGNNWHIHELSPIENGAAVLTLIKEDLTLARVHICAHHGSPQGVASTDLLDLVLMDGGKGNSPTDEKLGRVILGIAGQIKNRENELLDHAEKISKLQTHDDRLALYKDQGLT